MAGVFATLLTTPRTINISADAKGPSRHVYDELLALQAQGDPELASPYAGANQVSAIQPMSVDAVSGNFTITISIPKYNIEVTTGNIIYTAAEATIQTAVDAALAGETIVATYVAGHVDVSLSQNLNDTANAATLTFNGASVLGSYAIVTTQDVDLGVAALGGVSETTVGTEERPAEAVLALYSCLVPATVPAPQGTTPSEGDYVTGDNPLSLSPGTKRNLVTEVIFREDATIGRFLESVADCVG